MENQTKGGQNRAKVVNAERVTKGAAAALGTAAVAAVAVAAKKMMEPTVIVQEKPVLLIEMIANKLLGK